MARWVGLEAFASGNLFEQPTLEKWALATQQRNEESLHLQRAPDGSVIEPNRPSWARQKGHAEAGFYTGQMGSAMGDPACIEILSSNTANVLAVPETSGAEWAAFNVGGGKGPTPDALKLTMFVDGTGERKVTKTAIRKNKKKANTVKKWTATIPGQVARDFVGHDEKVVDAAAAEALVDVAQQWGFA